LQVGDRMRARQAMRAMHNTLWDVDDTITFFGHHLSTPTP